MKFGKWSKKKLMLATAGTFGAVAMTAGAVVAVVACQDFGDLYRPWGTYQLVTDAGSIQDKSFNEGVWNGLVKWAYSSNNVNKETFGYTQPSQTTTALLQKGYLTSIYNGAKYLILPGFTHGGTGQINKFLNDYPDVRAIGIDTDPPSGTSAVGITSFKQVVHAQFYTQESGFLAALAIGLFSNSPKSNGGFVVKGSTIKTAIFGGQPYPSVTSYMDGMLQGMDFFNKYVDNQLTDYPYAATDFPELASGQKPFKFELYFNKSAEVSGSIKPHFTGSFAAGDAYIISSDYLANGVQFIAGAAGPQTGDAVSAIRNTGLTGQAFAVGVDTEQSALYGTDYIIGSEMKGLAKTTYDILSLDDNGKPKFDDYIQNQGQGVTWFGQKDAKPGDSLDDPNEMFTGFAFNPVYRKTFGSNPFLSKFGKSVENREKGSSKGVYMECTDGFGTYTFPSGEIDPSDDELVKRYDGYLSDLEASKAGDCGLTTLAKINSGWVAPHLKGSSSTGGN